MGSKKPSERLPTLSCARLLLELGFMFWEYLQHTHLLGLIHLFSLFELIYLTQAGTVEQARSIACDQGIHQECQFCGCEGNFLSTHESIEFNPPHMHQNKH